MARLVGPILLTPPYLLIEAPEKAKEAVRFAIMVDQAWANLRSLSGKLGHPKKLGESWMMVLSTDPR